MPKTTAGAIASVLSEILEMMKQWFSSKRIRYSLEANKQALKYIRRVEKLDKKKDLGLMSDKTLRKYKKKFIDLTTAQ